MLSFEWDDGKNRANKKKHGISFEEAQSVFFDEHCNSINVVEPPEKPDVNWLLCYSFEATRQLDLTLALYKHWRDTAKAYPECALDEALAVAVDEQMKLADKTVGVLMDQVGSGPRHGSLSRATKR